MQSIDTAFTRKMLSLIAPSVREAGYRTMKDGWVYHFHGDHWEFHGPQEFYWHGSAGTAYDARYKGWSAWLKKIGPTSTPKWKRKKPHERMASVFALADVVRYRLSDLRETISLTV